LIRREQQDSMQTAPDVVMSRAVLAEPCPAVYRADGGCPSAGDSRDGWFDVLCVEVLTLAGPSIDIVRRYAPLSSRPDFGASAVVVAICNQARRAVATVRIVEQLVASGALSGCASSWL
jgi:hypothetical protein